MNVGEVFFIVFLLICLGFFIYDKFFYRREQVGLRVKDDTLESPQNNEYNSYLSEDDKAYRLWKSLLDRTTQDKINWKYDVNADSKNNFAVDKRDYTAKINGVKVEVSSTGYLWFDANMITNDSCIKNFMDLHTEISRSLERIETEAMEKDKIKIINKFLGKGKKSGR